ncbi:hypothetical protein T492DRAFT_932822, partial [Pavlovales sp. CCMP2436]
PRRLGLWKMPGHVRQKRRPACAPSQGAAPAARAASARRPPRAVAAPSGASALRRRTSHSATHAGVRVHAAARAAAGGPAVAAHYTPTDRDRPRAMLARVHHARHLSARAGPGGRQRRRAAPPVSGRPYPAGEPSRVTDATIATTRRARASEHSLARAPGTYIIRRPRELNHYLTLKLKVGP